MLANAAALAEGAPEAACEVDGLPWRQPPFAYQAKCLRWLRAAWDGLSGSDRAAAAAALAGSGCEALFT
jgi:hypothetical protein